jgi:iron complex transport system substrate-binding protein
MKSGSGLPHRPLTRRQVLAAGLAASAGFAFGCGSAQTQTSGWTFVDDRQRTARLPRRPARIVAYTTAAAALHDWGITPVGVFGNDPPEDPVLADFPWGRSAVVGSVYGEMDVATLESRNAELVVSLWYPPPAATPLFGFKSSAQERQVSARVPVVGLNGHAIATRQLERFGDLVAALGVDTTAGAVAEARAAFFQAAARLSSAARGKSDLRIIAVSADESTMYVAKLADQGDLAFYRRRGVPLISAQTAEAYWDRFSWKHARRYPADGILYDSRGLFLPLADAKKIPAFAALPAVRAGQIAPWYVEPPPSYQAFTHEMGQMATTMAGWRKLT